MLLKIFPGKADNAPLVLLNAVEDDGERIYAAANSLPGIRDFSLAVISGIDWNRQLSPWKAGAVFRGGEDFGGCADEYIREIENEIYPEILNRLGGVPEFSAIAGYSMAGLFALYALYRTSIFTRCASCSGSLWFPGFVDFTQKGNFAANVDRLYFSLGSKEPLTKNPVMKNVGICTETLAEAYRKAGIPTEYEINEGNHFCNTEMRTAKGIKKVLAKCRIM